MLRLKHNDVVKVTSARSFQRQSVCTLSGCLLKYDSREEVAEKYEQRKDANGTAGAAWLSAQPVIIADTPVDRSYVAEVSEGEHVFIESDWPGEQGIYIVTRPPRALGGDSWRLMPIADHPVFAEFTPETVATIVKNAES